MKGDDFPIDFARLEPEHEKQFQKFLLHYKPGSLSKYRLRLLREFGDHCEICEAMFDIPFDEDKGDDLWQHVHIDHDHKTQKVRGLLCANCNVILGRLEKVMEKSPEINWFDKAKQYLERVR